MVLILMGSLHHSSVVVSGEFHNMSLIFDYVNMANVIGGKGYQASKTAGCVRRVGPVADWDGNAIRRYNYFSYEGGTAKYEELTC
jgi:hypothetical protein